MLSHFAAIFKNRAARESFKTRAFIVALFLSVFFAIFEYSIIRTRVDSDELYTGILFVLIVLTLVFFYYIIIVMEDSSIREDIVEGMNIKNDVLNSEGANTTTMIQSNSKYDAFFENKSIGIFEYDADGYLLKCNVRALEIFGYREEDIYELNLLGAKVNSSVKSAIRDSLEFGSGFSNGFVYPKGNKVQKSIVITTSVKNNTGIVMGGIGIIKDEAEYGTLWKTE